MAEMLGHMERDNEPAQQIDVTAGEVASGPGRLRLQGDLLEEVQYTALPPLSFADHDAVYSWLHRSTRVCSVLFSPQVEAFRRSRQAQLKIHLNTGGGWFGQYCVNTSIRDRVREFDEKAETCATSISLYSVRA
ncbi:hypothetical protein CERZMDRAFT_97861 [Cercospora zeae-maydis SCOH1-5]|uniref:Uncharacterized protein n=1 Tax=Cercospora zeae-maydis SCOH1-5 TaxID=717836 RepID=A0A6A6FEY6_9PEZI|nr:hypothetical protein CERZMDRAFT_97861 [Cercospora zeae-maydis SCOH1-5]